MSNMHFCNFTESNTNGTEKRNDIDNHNTSDNEDNNEDNEDDSEFLQDVPYSSTGSFDRSSIGSIPWADDAIKQNQMGWEQVERMLSGEDPLPTEPDMRNEILEWQVKFPQLLGKKIDTDVTQMDYTQDTYTLPDDLISHLSLNSSSDEDRYDELDTPTAKKQEVDNFPQKSAAKRDKPNPAFNDKLSSKMALLRITALPLRLSHRSDISTINAHLPQRTSKEERAQSAALKSLNLDKISAGIPQTHKLSSTTKHNLTQYKDAKIYETRPQQHQQRYHMPPILNVLESKKRFRDLTSNKSFVQLTHIKSPQHTKSAAIIRQIDISSPLIRPQPRKRATPTLINGGVDGHSHQSAWQRPLLATRVNSNFFNNRNAIILPALNTQRISALQQTHERRNSTTTASTSGANTRTNSLSNSNIGLSSSSSANLNFRPHYAADRFVSRWQQQLNAVNHHTSTSTGTMSTGRSISAAIRHNARDVTGGAYSEFYMPSYTPIGYNKHDSFK